MPEGNKIEMRLIKTEVVLKLVFLPKDKRGRIKFN